MTTVEAIAICEAWFAHNERQRAQAVEMQRLAQMARHGQAEEARKLMANIDRTPLVFDGSRLEPAVRFLVEHIGTLQREQLCHRELI